MPSTNRQMDKLRGFLLTSVNELCEDMRITAVRYTTYSLENVIPNSKATLKSSVEDMLISIATVKDLVDALIKLVGEELFVEFPELAPEDFTGMADDQLETDEPSDTAYNYPIQAQDIPDDLEDQRQTFGL